MTEIRTDPKTVAQEYRQLPPADKAVFRTILELAILAEPDKLPPVVQRALDAGFHDLADEIDRRRNRMWTSYPSRRSDI